MEPEFKRYKKKLSYGDARNLPFQIYFKKTGFPMICADWCEENCIGYFGWFFMPEEDQEHGWKPYPTINDVYIAFENQNDLFMFQLYWAEEFGGKRE